MADRSPLLVVDAPSLLFRAYYALPASIKDAEGRPVNALLGSVNIMLNEIAGHSPRAVVMAFGQDAADYRVELYPDYHADRRELEADEDIDRQFELAPDLYEAFGWESVSAPGLEADDVLGSYALAERDAGVIRGTSAPAPGTCRDRDRSLRAADQFGHSACICRRVTERGVNPRIVRRDSVAIA